MFEIPDDDGAPLAAPASHLDTTADAIVSEIPEPQQHAIDEATRAAAADPESPTASVETDVLGIPWSPSEHATGADGKGVRTAKGTWRKRRGLKGTASHVATDAAGRVPAESEEEVNRRTSEQQSRMAGAMAGTFVIRVSTAIGGDHFASQPHAVPGTNITWHDEPMLQQAFGDYFVATGRTDMPPVAALIGALMLYYLPRFQQPEVRARAGGMVHWCKEKVSVVRHWIKFRKAPKKTNGKGEEPHRPQAPGINPDV